MLGLAPGLLFGSLVGLAPWPAAAPTSVGLAAARDRRAADGRDRASRSSALAALLALLRGRRSAAPAPSWACGQLVEPPARWTSAGFTKPLRLVLEVVLRPQREIAVRTTGGVVQEVSYSGHVPAADRGAAVPAGRRALALAAAAQARRLQSGRLGTYVAYLIGLVVVLLAAARLGVIG